MTAKNTNAIVANEDITYEHQINDLMMNFEKRMDAAQANIKKERKILEKNQEELKSQIEELKAIKSAPARAPVRIVVQESSFVQDAIEAIAVGVVAGCLTYGAILLIDQVIKAFDE